MLVLVADVEMDEDVQHLASYDNHHLIEIELQM